MPTAPPFSSTVRSQAPRLAGLQTSPAVSLRYIHASLVAHKPSTPGTFIGATLRDATGQPAQTSSFEINPGRTSDCALLMLFLD